MQSQERLMRVINHKTMRKGTGWIALLMPWFVVLLSGQPEAELSSISVSYWTDSRDIFVGCLIAVAFFLMAYNGTGACIKDTEFWLSKVASVFAVLVALFPTTCSLDKCTDAPRWIVYISYHHPQYVHYTAAILLFACLILLLAFFSLRAKYKGELSRSRIYSLMSLSMLIGMPVVFCIGKFTRAYEPVYWVECMGLTLFGLGWLLAGTYKNKPEEPVPDSAVLLDTVEVDPSNTDNFTKIIVEAGAQYLFKAEGCWKDGFLECGANGWGPNWNPLAANNRIKGRPLFMLCGNVGKSWNDENRTFCIGDRGIWTVPAEFNALDQEERKLYLFANDWKTRYGNNYALNAEEGGPLTVTIYRL